MKKIMRIILALSLVMLCGCGNKFKGKIVEKTAGEIIEMFKNGESFLMYARQKDCETCARFKITLQDLISEYDLTIYSMLGDDETQTDNINAVIYNYLIRLEYTPTFYIIKDGKVVHYDEKGKSLVEYDYLKSMLETYDVLPK